MRRHLLLLLLLGASMGQAFAQIEESGNIVVYNPRKSDDRGENKAKLKFLNRNDLLWHAEAANVAYRKAGNGAIFSASRYGLTDRLELSTFLATDVIRPNLYAKALWKVFNKRWFLTSRFDVANAYSGMKLLQKKDVTKVIAKDAKIPLIFEFGHEFLLSRAWFTDQNCSDGSVYLAMTFGLAFYGGIKMRDEDTRLPQPRWHFLANRAETVMDNGFRTRIKLWADGRINSRLFLHGGVYYHIGSFVKKNAVELQGEGEYFFNQHISAKVGVLMSFAHYENVDKHFGALPILDFSYYFGTNKSRNGSLFQKGVYKPSKGI